MFEIKGKFSTASVMIDLVEPECISQITKLVNHVAFTNPIVIQPDCHAGKGAVIGFTMLMTDKVIPNITGVDVGCGMFSFPVLEREFNVFFGNQGDKLIRNAIPFGTDVREDDKTFKMKRDFPWSAFQRQAGLLAERYQKTFGIPLTYYHKVWDEVFSDMREKPYEWFKKKCQQIGIDYHRAERSIGTLGGGNHFIEIGIPKVHTKIDGEPILWVTIHSGSRQFGKCVADYWQGVAVKRVKRSKDIDLKAAIEQIKKNVPRNQIEKNVQELRNSLGFNVQSNGLEFLEGEDAQGYLFDMLFAQLYANVNRKEMACAIIRELDLKNASILPEDDAAIIRPMNTIHNYIGFDDFIIRKGAVSSRKANGWFVVPLNMRDGILVCEGKDNAAWNFSAPHGAGRIMSRSKAKKTLNLTEFQKTMGGIFSTSVCKGTLDEAPMAYKDSALIEAAIEPTATIVDRIIPIHNMKDSEGDED